MIITIFEDQENKSLYPINQLRASFELRCGAFTNLERIQQSLNSHDEIQFLVRDEIKNIVQERYPHISVNPELFSPGVWLNGQALWRINVISKDSLRNL